MKSGWVTKKLGEVCELIGGGTPSIHVSCYYGGNIPWATVRDMNCRVISKTERKITKQGLENSASNIIPAGNVVISTHVGLGKVCFVAKDTAINQDLKGVIPLGENLNRTYLYYWFLSIADFLVSSGTGSTVRGVKLEFVKNLDIPIPPLAEQKRIVAKIDAAFEKIDAMKANAERNLANAKELFQSALDEAMRPKKGWVEKRLGEVGEYRKGPFGSALTKRIFVPKDPKTVKVYEQKNAIQKSVTLGEYYITREYFTDKMKGFEVLPGDVIVSCAGTIGETFIMPEEMEQGIINQALMRMRINPGINKAFFLYYFDHVLKKSANELSNGSAMKNIPPFSVFKQLPIPVPPAVEQKQIVARLDSLSAKCESLQQNYARQIEDCAEMRQAILKDAFEGKF